MHSLTHFFTMAKPWSNPRCAVLWLLRGIWGRIHFRRHYFRPAAIMDMLCMKPNHVSRPTCTLKGPRSITSTMNDHVQKVGRAESVATTLRCSDVYNCRWSFDANFTCCGGLLHEHQLVLRQVSEGHNSRSEKTILNHSGRLRCIAASTHTALGMLD